MARFQEPPHFRDVFVELPDGTRQIDQGWHDWFLNLARTGDQDLSGYAQFAFANVFTRVQTVTPYRADITGAVSIDLSATARSNNLHLTLTGNVSSFALTNPSDGAVYNIRFIQDGTGSRTFAAFPAAFKFAGGTAPTFTTTANGVDFMSCQYGSTEASYMCSFLKGMFWTVAGDLCVPDTYYSCGPIDDPYWVNVVLMLHGDGTNGGTTFTDSSASTKIAAVFGSAQLSTTAPKFGTASMDVGSSGNNYLSYTQANNPSNYLDFQLTATEDYTVECWAYPTTTSGTHTLVSFREADPMRLMIIANALIVQAANEGTTILDSGTLSWASQWYHLAATKSGNDYRLFRDGILVASLNSAANYKTGNGYPLHVGINDASVWPFRGKIDDLRITKGIARYTDNFNIPTAAFPDALETVWSPTAPRTVLSLHAENTSDSSCAQPKTVTLTGTASISTAEKKFGDSAFAVANDGTNRTNGMVINDHQDFDFGTGDFTIEMWAYRLANTYRGTLFYYSETVAFSLVVETTGLITLNYRSSGGTQAPISTGVTFPLTTWQHVVVQRRGTNFEFYLTGVLGNTTAIAGGASSTVNSISNFFLGRTNVSSARSWDGYIDEVRITKGAARYAAPFTPPSLPFCPET